MAKRRTVGKLAYGITQKTVNRFQNHLEQFTSEKAATQLLAQGVYKYYEQIKRAEQSMGTQFKSADLEIEYLEGGDATVYFENHPDEDKTRNDTFVDYRAAILGTVEFQNGVRIKLFTRLIYKPFWQVAY